MAGRTSSLSIMVAALVLPFYDTVRLAEDIVSTDRATRQEIRRIMDAGWGATLGEGLEIERDANAAHGRSEVRAEKVAARRADIQSRGREQSRD